MTKQILHYKMRYGKEVFLYVLIATNTFPEWWLLWSPSSLLKARKVNKRMHFSISSDNSAGCRIMAEKARHGTVTNTARILGRQ